MRSTSLLMFTLLAGVAPHISLGPDSRVALVWGPSVVAAQTPEHRSGASTRTIWVSTDPRYTARIPLRTTQLKAVGVQDSTISRLLDIFRTNDLSPQQIDRVFVTERDNARLHGPTDNFGAFVQTQLAAGKRGRALAAAIHEEHRRHGHKHDAEHARKQKAKDDRDAARERARERERVRHEGPDRPMVNPRQP